MGKGMLIAGVLAAACLLLRATPSSPPHGQPTRLTATANPAPARSRVATEKIEDVEVGKRTLGHNPLRDQVDPNAPEPDPKTWRKLLLRMEKGGGGALRITLLRPVEWIEAAGAETGGDFFLNLPEMGAVGEARVEAIEPCPPIQPGPGQVVTGTFRHEASPGTRILRIEFSNGSLIEGVTDTHPFWSEDRRDFVSAGELHEGDHVRTSDGTAAITSIAPCLARLGEMLYNLEVHNEHVYQVKFASSGRFDGNLVIFDSRMEVGFFAAGRYGTETDCSFGTVWGVDGVLSHRTRAATNRRRLSRTT